jgi:hypothetical protein
MQHHHDVGPLAQGLGIAGLLVAAVAAVLRMLEGQDAEAAGLGHGAVVARVVDQQHLVDHVARDVAIRLLQGLGRAEGGQHHHDLLSVKHDRFYLRGRLRTRGGR